MDAADRIEPRNIEQEMRESYLDYAMSVIVSRALPDVRDGLKPVHRRILYAMHEMSLTSRAGYARARRLWARCWASITRTAMSPSYDTLVRLAQDFNMRYPLVDGQGNFGSIDGDSPAAMRYTECRMTAITDEMLADIDKNTVDLVSQLRRSRDEPVSLPARLPNLLVNGAAGIAVGMATNIPPHNLREVTNAIIHLIDNPGGDQRDLVEFVQGPDFPTGGIIMGREGIDHAYGTGQGRIVVRAVPRSGGAEGRPLGDRRHRTAVPGQQGDAAGADRRHGPRQEDRRHLGSARRVGPPWHAAS